MNERVRTVYASDELDFELKIDHEFRGFVPAPSADELKQLEENVVSSGGPRDPLVAWLRDNHDLVLVDGHNRYEICRRRGLPFTIAEMHFDSRDEVLDWIDRNQLGRRNLSRQDYKLLLGRRYNRAKRADNARPGNDNASKERGGQSDHREKTAEKIAREHGVGEATVRRAGQFQAAAAKLGIEKEIAAGKVKATEAQVVKVAKTLPAKPTPAHVSEAVATLEPKSRREPSKATVNNHDERKVTMLLLQLQRTVERLDHNVPAKSARRRSIGRELRRVGNDLLRMADAIDLGK